MAEEAIYENHDAINMRPTSQVHNPRKEGNAYSNVSVSDRPSQNHRWVSVGLGLFYVLLLALNIGLGIKGSMWKNQLLAEREHLVVSYSNASMEKGQLLASNSNLTTQVQELLIANGQLQARISKLERRCPSGWRYFNTKCYFISSSSKTWSESRQHCKDSGGDLVIINSKEEQVFLHGLEKWIGLRKINGVWRWVDNTQVSTEYWDKRQPDGGDEDCVLGTAYAGETFSSWHDYPCKDKHGFICEMSAYI